jgi:hypothetical protein
MSRSDSSWLSERLGRVFGAVAGTRATLGLATFTPTRPSAMAASSTTPGEKRTRLSDDSLSGRWRPPRLPGLEGFRVASFPSIRFTSAALSSESSTLQIPVVCSSAHL